MFNNKPLITIVTVVYNGESILEKTLLSIISQTYENIEYIIIDGGSTDSTTDIIERYSNRITFWISEKDKGIYDAMNKAIDCATGEWICFMNADDMFASEHTILDVFNSNKIDESVDVVYGDTVFDYSEFKVIANAKPINFLNKGMSFTHQSCFIRTKYHKKHKYLLKYDIAADFDFFHRAYIFGRKFQYTNSVISIMSIGGVSDSSRFKTLRQNHEIVNQFGFSVLKNFYFIYLYADLLIRSFAKRLLPRVAVAYLTKNKRR